MEIGLSSLCDRLARFEPAPHVLCDQNVTYRGARFLSASAVDLSPELLHIGLVSELPVSVPKGSRGSFFCVADVPLPPEFQKSLDINLVLFPSSVRPGELFEAVEELFQKQRQIAFNAAALLNVFCKGGGLQGIVNQGCKIFGNPVCVIDNGLRLIAASNNVEIKDPFIRNIIEHRYFTREIVNLLNNNHLHEGISRSLVPIIVGKNNVFENNRIVGMIYSSGKPIGHFVVVIENGKEIDQYDIEMATVLRDVIAQEMQKSYFVNITKGLSYEYFISDLLDGKTFQPELLKDRMRYLNVQFQETIHVLTIDISKSEEAISQFEARDQVENLAQNSRAVIYDGQIVVIIDRSSSNPLTSEDTNAFKEFCRSHHLYGAISNPFSRITDLHTYYRQTLKTIELGALMHNAPTLLAYEDFAVYHLADLFAKHEHSSAHCHPVINFLDEYDRKSNTEYLRTLYMYLLHERNIVVAAEAMHVHRNTLQYRLKKIEELVSLDLDSPTQRQYLISSCRMLVFMKYSSGGENLSLLAHSG